MKKLFGASKKEAVTPWREAPSGLNLEQTDTDQDRLRRPISQQLSPKPPYTTARSASPSQFDSARSNAFAHTAYPSYGESYEVPLDRHAKTAQRHDATSLGRSTDAETIVPKLRAYTAEPTTTTGRSGKKGASTTDYANDSQHNSSLGHQRAADGGSLDLNSAQQALPAPLPSWNTSPRAQNTPAEAQPSSAHSSPRLGRWKSLRRSVEGGQASYDETPIRNREAPMRTHVAATTVAEAAPYPSYAAPVAFVQGHRVDAQAHTDNKPKRKLFSFGAMGKDKKDKVIFSGAAGTDYTSDVSNAAALSDPSVATAKQQSSKEHSWYDVRGAKGSGAKSTDGVITSKIGWLCGNPVEAWDWNYLLELADTISHSEAAAREAARALRKELKYGEAEPRKRAVKVWAVLTLNGSDRFKMQIANKRFLEVVEELVTSIKTPFKLKELLIDVFGMLAYEFKDDAELALLTKSYNKVRPGDCPLNGTPLDPQHAIFVPAVGMGASVVRRKHQSRVPSPDEDIRRLHEECAIARTSVQMLFEALAGPGMDSDLVREFSEKIQHSHDFISAQVPWATAQADLSRSRQNDADMRANAESRQKEPREATKEENLLGDLLDANEKLTEARGMLDATHARHFEEDDEAQRVIERSRVEVRLDRSALQQDPVTGEFYDLDTNHCLAAPAIANRASGSGRASPAPKHRLIPSHSPAKLSDGLPSALLAGVQGHARQPSASSGSSRADSQRATPGSTQHSELGFTSAHHHESQRATPTPVTSGGHIGGPRPLPAYPTGASSGSLTAPPPSASSVHLPVAETGPMQLLPLVVPTPRDANASSDDTGDTESIVETPIQPSEKALGKRRQFSDRGDAFEPVVQEEAFARANAAAQRRNETELRARPPPPVPARAPAVGVNAVAPNGVMMSTSEDLEGSGAAPAPVAPYHWAPTNPFHPSALRPGQVQQDASQSTNPFEVRS